MAEMPELKAGGCSYKPNFFNAFKQNLVAVAQGNRIKHAIAIATESSAHNRKI